MKDELRFKYYLLSDALNKIEHLIGYDDNGNALEPNNELDCYKGEVSRSQKPD